MEKTITLTQTEANALLHLIDLGVKSGGLQVAGNGAFLAQKINLAFATTEGTEKDETAK